MRKLEEFRESGDQMHDDFVGHRVAKVEVAFA